MPICNTGDNTPVMEINNAAVVPHIMVLQKKMREIGTPFLIDFIRSEILLQLVFKHFMWFPVLIIRLLPTDNRTNPQFRIPIFMDGHRAVAVTFPLQIDRHAPLTVNSIVFVVNFLYRIQNLRFVGIIIRLPVFSVVVISIGIYLQPS